MSDIDEPTRTLLAALGLSITPHSDPAHGWGYCWQNRDWVGPFTTPSAALHAAFTDALLAIQFRSDYSWVSFSQAGELWQFKGEGEGWMRIGGPGTEDDEEATMMLNIHTLSSALDTLRETDTRDIVAPGPAQRWEQALRAGYQAYSNVETLLDSWHDELGKHHEREGLAQDSWNEKEK